MHHVGLYTHCNMMHGTYNVEFSNVIVALLSVTLNYKTFVHSIVVGVPSVSTLGEGSMPPFLWAKRYTRPVILGIYPWVKVHNVRTTDKAVSTAVGLESGLISEGRNICTKLCVKILFIVKNRNPFTLDIVRKKLLQVMNRMLNRMSFFSRGSRVQL